MKQLPWCFRNFCSFWILFGLILGLTPGPASSQEVLVNLGATWKFFRGKTAPSTPATAWRQTGFNDAAWESGPAPIGYEAGVDGVLIDIATELSDMRQIADDPATPQDESRPGYYTFYARRAFNVTQAQIDAINDPANTAIDLVLSIRYDDGYICYLNGTEVRRDSAGTAPAELAFDDPATGGHEGNHVSYRDISASASLLVVGQNVIAVEVHNTPIDSSDVTFDLRLAGNDPRTTCPSGLACTSSPGAVQLTWTNSATAVYDQIAVTRNGTPIAGSPFPGDTVTATDSAPGNFFNTYQVTGRVAGVDCDSLVCVTNECPTGIACASSAAGVTISWTNSANVAYDSIAVTRNGTPIQGSPFPGTTQSVVDGNPGSFLNTYQVSARIGGQSCSPALECESTNQFDIINVGDDWKFFRGKTAPSSPATAWRELGFNDASWETGPTGIGYGDDDDATVLADMQQIADDPATPENESQPGYLTVYCRKSFSVLNVASVSSLTLTVDYDDGHITYLNGVEVARSATMGAAGTEFTFDQQADAGHDAGTASTYDLSGFISSVLRTGNNVLAVEVHNRPITSSDLSFIPTLTANACFTGSGLACVYDEATDDVTISFNAISVDSFKITRNGAALPGSPFPGDTTVVVDQNPGSRDNLYEIVAVVAGSECPAVTCTVDCGIRNPEALACTLRLVSDGAGGFVTQAQLSWTVPAGTTSIEVRREGAVIATLPSTATSYTDPNVESDQPEDDTDYDVEFSFADGTTCTIGTPALLLCPQDLVCEVVDSAGVQRAKLTWGNMVKEWETINIERDADGIIESLAGTATSYTDIGIEQVPGETHTYTVVPVAPVGEGAPGDTTEVNCSLTCTVAAQVPELADYQAPAGGWGYIINFENAADDRYVAQTQVKGNLDGQWIRAVNDSWDGSAPMDAVGPAPGGPAPGGVEVITSAGSAACGANAGVLRLLNPGDTSAPTGTLAAAYPDAFDEPNNRSIFLGYNTGVNNANLLRSGVTFAARWRVRPAADSPAFMSPSATGDGVGLDGSRGQVGIYFVNDGSLAAAGNSAALSFALNSGDVGQLSTNPVSTLNAHDVDRWRSVWVTVQDPEDDNTYDITLYTNGQMTPAPFIGAVTGVGLLQTDFTADIGGVDTPYFDAAAGNFLAIGLPGVGGDADIEIDYIAYKAGVFAPSATPCGGGNLFKRSDADNNGATNITDGIYLLNHLFLGGPAPPCKEAADANNDGGINITDGIYILNFLFLGGPAPAAPGQTTCGPDTDAPGSPKDLGCITSKC